ncbi:hypothetical protein [Candidatus Poriferisodalis sp.]|uniref:hypothetical protein n=1 Tax=Candidatus Poriferisodalis sp. TaxID=3101277 RepID=UPI003B014D65
MDDPELPAGTVIHDHELEECAVASGADGEDAPVVSEVDLVRVTKGMQDVGIGHAVATR